MRNHNFNNYNNREFYSKTFIRKNDNKKPNALYYLSLENARYTSIGPKKMKYHINKIKEKNKKLTNNTLDTKKERYMPKNKKNEKAFDRSYSNNYRFYSSNKKHSELNDTLNYKNYIINNKNNFSFSIIFNELFDLKKDKKNYIKKSTNLSKNKVIENETNNKKTNKGRNNDSFNITDSWINFRNSIFNNNKTECKKQKIVPKKNKNEINNYSYSFVHNDLLRNSRKIENEKNLNFNISKKKRSLFRKENEKILSNFNNSKTKKLLKDNDITIENNFVKKVYKKDNAISSSKNKGKVKNKYKLNKKLTKNMKVFGNINISSKPTYFSSYLNSEQNMKSSLISNEFIKQNKLNKNINEDLPINDNCILNYSIESNGKDIQEYESKFLNYELGFSDKISTSNYTLDNNDNCNKDNIRHEYEKPVEEIEEIANQIINNSNYRNKTISIINKKLISTKVSKENFYNDDVEELKKGERIQKVLNIYISQNNNNNKS
jgi:hypothetical protein